MNEMNDGAAAELGTDSRARIEPVDARADVATDPVCAALIDLWHRCDLTRPWNDPADDLRRAIQGPTSAVLVARDEPGQSGEEFADLLVVLGSVMVGVDGHRGWVYYLAVDPDRRRAGLGALLMRAAESWLAARGAPKVQLMVREGNESVLRFYADLGYTDQASVLIGRFLDPEVEALRRDHLGTSG